MLELMVEVVVEVVEVDSIHLTVISHNPATQEDRVHPATPRPGTILRAAVFVLRMVLSDMEVRPDEQEPEPHREIHQHLNVLEVPHIIEVQVL
jgi:hypothetical protein